MKIIEEMTRAYYQTRYAKGQRIFLLGPLEYRQLRDEFFKMHYSSEQPSSVGLSYYNEMSSKFVEGGILFMNIPVVESQNGKGIEVVEVMEWRL